MSIFQLLILALILHHPSAHAARLPVIRSVQCPVVLPNDIPLSRSISRDLPDPQPRQVRDAEKQLEKSPRIVGGDFTTSPSLNDMLVSLRNSDYSCTGTLISARWVVSAAHCEFDTTWTAAVGATQAGVDGDRIPVRRAVNHPKYRNNFEQFDIAILHLERPAQSTSFMLVNMNPAMPPEESFVRVAGYGTIVFDAEEDRAEKGRLRQVDVPVFRFKRCNRLFGGLVDKAQICTGYPLGGCDSCSGDSGGPVFQYDSNGNPVLMGLVSFGDECGNANSPAVNIRVSYFVEWMRRRGAVFNVSEDAQSVFAEIPRSRVD